MCTMCGICSKKLFFMHTFVFMYYHGRVHPPCGTPKGAILIKDPDLGPSETKTKDNTTK